MKSLLTRIQECKTKEELDGLRREIVNVGREGGTEKFKPLQSAFIKRQREIRHQNT